MNSIALLSFLNATELTIMFFSRKLKPRCHAHAPTGMERNKQYKMLEENGKNLIVIQVSREQMKFAHVARPTSSSLLVT